MVRLGAKYTVAGYLDEVVKRSFLTTTEKGPANFRAFVAKLRSDWGIDDFVALFENFLVPFGWNYTIDHEKSALGKRAQIKIFLPSALQIFHFGEADGPVWSEKALTAHCWSIKVRKGKAKLDVIPTSLYISEHALRRIYERSGGCSYDEFPQLAATVFQEVLDKTDTLVRECIFVQGENKKLATAVPTSGGLVVVNWDLLLVNGKDPNLGILIKLNGKHFSRGSASYVPSEVWGLPPCDLSPNVNYYPSSFVRTYYSDEDLSEARSRSCIFIDILLNNVEPSSIMPSNILAAAKNPAGRRVLPDLRNLPPQATAGLRADIIESLHWLHAEDSGLLYLAPYEKSDQQNQKFLQEINIAKFAV